MPVVDIVRCGLLLCGRRAGVGVVNGGGVVACWSIVFVAEYVCLRVSVDVQLCMRLNVCA